jgi:hypothetical protein
VYARATRIACIVASVPDTVMRALLDPAGELLDELDRLRTSSSLVSEKLTPLRIRSLT